MPPLQLHDYLGEICAAEKVEVAPGVLSFVVRAGGGSVRDSLSVLDQLMAGSGDEGLTYEGAAALLGFTDGELLDATIDGFAAGDGASVFRQVDKVIETGHDPRRFVGDLLERLRDLIVVAAVPEGASSVLRGIPEDQLERMRQQSAAFGSGALSRSADIVNAGLTEMTGATAPRLQLELICARVLLPGASGESGYAARLDRLERRLEVTGAVASNPPAVAVARVLATASESPAAVKASSARMAQAGGPERENEVVAKQQRLRAVEPRTVQPAKSPVKSSEQPSAVDSPPVVTRRLAPMPGGIDTDAIRRSWPDVLARIATISRVTWSFVSQNTRVLDYNGERLLLGLSTDGLLSALRGRNHAEVVRQALIEVIGVDTRVEGVLATEATPVEVASVEVASVEVASVEVAAAKTTQPAVSSDPEPTDDWNTSTPPPDPSGSPTPPSMPDRPAVQARMPASDRPAVPVRTPGSDLPSTPRQRARAAVAQEASRRNTSSSSSVADDSLVSADDEDIEEAGAIGQPVIERVLGGIVIGELDQ